MRTTTKPVVDIRRMRISANRLNELIRKKRGVTTWLRLLSSRMKRVALSDVNLRR